MPTKVILFSFLISLFLLISCKEEKEISQKLSPDLRSTLIDLEKSGQKEKPIVVVFRVSEDLTQLHYDVLKRKKIKILANIGPIYTASLPAEKVIDLAKMKFVDHIQGERTFKTTPRDTANSNFKFKEKDK